jgi:hypothetical protein
MSSSLAFRFNSCPPYAKNEKETSLIIDRGAALSEFDEHGRPWSAKLDALSLGL